MRIFILDPCGDSSLKIDNSNPWNNLLNQRRDIVQVEDPRNAEFFLINNLTRRSIRFVRKYCTPKNSALLIWESEVTCPGNFRSKLHRNFKMILAPSPIWAARVGGKAFDWPQNNPSNFVGSKQNLRPYRLEKWVMVQSKKYGFTRGELYSLRNKVLVVNENDIDLWGYGWNSKSIQNLLKTFVKHRSINVLKLINDYNFNKRMLLNYRGETSNKIETMSEYKFALVIENSIDYVSEKLIDAIIAGSIPIYVGPNLENFGIPQKVAINSAPDILEITRKMREVKENITLQEQTLEAGSDFILSNRFQSMINTKVFASLGNILAEELLS